MSTPNSPSSSSTRPVLTRASKGKSRAGCITCKKRKVKCDEVHPSCTNCCRRSHPCLYKVSEAPRWKQGLATLVLPSLQPSRATRSDESANIVTKSDESKGKSDEDVVSLKQSEAALPRSLSCISSGFGQSFGIEDYYLLTKFDSLSSMEMLNYYELDVNKIIQLSFHNDFLLHSMLTLVARNLDRGQHQQSSSKTSTPSYDFKYLEQHHLQHALSKYHPALNPCSQSDQHAILATSFLLSFYSCSFADFSPFDGSLVEPSFTYLHGTRSIIVDRMNRPKQGLFRSVIVPPEWIYIFSSKIHPPLSTSEAGLHFLSLLSSLPISSPRLIHKDLYVARMESLSIYFAICMPRCFHDLTQETLSTISLCSIAWQACCPVKFVELIRCYDPIALVILAHFYATAGFVHALMEEGWWWWMDKPKVMVERIGDFLGEEWWEWMKFPREIIETFQGRSVMESGWRSGDGTRQVI